MSFRERKVSRAQMRGIYDDLRSSVSSMLKREDRSSAEESTSEDRSDHSKLDSSPLSSPVGSSWKSFDWSTSMLLPTIGSLALARFALSFGAIVGYLDVTPAQAVMISQPRPVSQDPNERFVLEALDSRRAELERRSGHLDDRAQELKEQERELTIKLAELRQIAHKLRDERTKKGVERNAQLEQLANVYVSMRPEEAARLLQQLDNMIALDLIKKMPEKRIGQLLSLMEPERALMMTRMLTGGKE